jgi:hypothetical protein
MRSIAALRCDAARQCGLPWAGKLVEDFLPTRHRHQECFSGTADFWSVAVLPGDVGRRES